MSNVIEQYKLEAFRELGHFLNANRVKLLVHAGLHKCGTTSIQEYFSRVASVNEDVGYLNYNLDLHSFVTKDEISKKSIDRCINSIRRECSVLSKPPSGEGLLLISHESLLKGSRRFDYEKRISRLTNLPPGTQFLITTRDPKSYAISLYWQFLKTCRFVGDPNHFFELNKEAVVDYKTLDLIRTIMFENFGQSNVKFINLKELGDLRLEQKALEVIKTLFSNVEAPRIEELSVKNQRTDIDNIYTTYKWVNAFKITSIETKIYGIREIIKLPLRRATIEFFKLKWLKSKIPQIFSTCIDVLKLRSTVTADFESVFNQFEEDKP